MNADLPVNNEGLANLSREQLIERLGLLNARVEELSEQVEAQKVTDRLTGLANRDYFLASLAGLCSRAKRFGQRVCMMLLDIDDFHLVNEQLGNLAGDLVLTGLADVLKSILRDYDLLARFGEDEFAIAIDNGEPEIARRLCQRIRNTLTRTPLCLSDRQVTVNLTIGVVTAGSDSVAERPDTMVRAAIEAIEIARRKGRNQTHWMDLDAAPAPAPAAQSTT